jgi:hypothetical protein
MVRSCASRMPAVQSSCAGGRHALQSCLR